MNRAPFFSFRPCAVWISLLTLILSQLGSQALASTGFDHDGNGNLTAVRASVAGLPVIVAQPLNQYAQEGGGAGFSVAVSSSSPVSFQWKREDGSNIDGATGDSLYFPKVSEALLGRYYVVITNASGSVTSASASIALSGLVRIRGGSFTMGRTSGDTDADAPPVTVTVSSFFLQDRKTTKALWDEVRTWALGNGYTDLPVGEGKAADHPVHKINWWDVVKWCNARSEMEGLTPCYTLSGAVLRTGTTVPTVNWGANGYRLPTEAEWEMAARGGVSGKRFPWGTDTISHNEANYNSSAAFAYNVSTTSGFHPVYATGSKPYTSPGNSFPANGFGLYDMSGNVWEWCWDWYGASTYTNGATDPRGAASGSLRIIRGGSYIDYASSARCAARVKMNPASRDTGSFGDNRFGFRPARGGWVAPAVSNATVTNANETSAILGGNVIADGGSSITERGVIYSPTGINSDPQIGDNGVTKLTGTGTTGLFTLAVSSLSPGTTYSYKAYAINSQGTAYTSLATFTTLRTNADLSNLTLSTGTLSPAFASAQASYTAVVSNSTSTIRVTPTRGQSNSTIAVRVNGGIYAAVSSSATSEALVLNLGSNTVDIRVTAHDGTMTKIYSIKVTRPLLPKDWRQKFYGTSSNTGNAADGASPYHNGMANLVVFALLGPDQNPATAQMSQLPAVQSGNGRLSLNFTEPPGVSGVIYGAEWSPDLINWSPVADTGSGSEHIFTVAIPGAKGFLRLTVVSQL